MPPQRPAAKTGPTKDAAQPAAPQNPADEVRRQESSEAQARQEGEHQAEQRREAEQAKRDADEAAEGEDERQEAAQRAAAGDGPEVIHGPPPITDATFRVEVTTSFVVGRETYMPFQKVEVPDNAETRAGIAVGFLRILDDDEELDDNTSAEVIGDGSGEALPPLDSTAAREVAAGGYGDLGSRPL